MIDEMVGWMQGAIFLCDFDYEETEYILNNFSEFYQRVTDVEFQVMWMQMGIDE